MNVSLWYKQMHIRVERKLFVNMYYRCSQNMQLCLKYVPIPALLSYIHLEVKFVSQGFSKVVSHIFLMLLF